MNVISGAENFGQSTLTVCLTPNEYALLSVIELLLFRMNELLHYKFWNITGTICEGHFSLGSGYY